MNFGLRTRFIGILVVATVVASIISAVAARVTVGGDLSRLGAQQVESGSTGFAGYWDAKRSGVKLLVQQVALDSTVRRSLASHDARALGAQLTTVARQGGLAFLTVVNVRGDVIARANGGPLGVNHPSPYIARALSGETISTAASITPAELAPEQLTPQVDAPLAGGSPGDKITTGLGLISAVPVSDANERTIGAVYGGVLLNHMYDVVDQTASSLGGKAGVIVGHALISSSISRPDGTRLVDSVTGVAAKATPEQPYQGVDVEGGTPYMARVEPIKDDQGNVVAARWYGVPMSVFDAIANHATMSIVLWGFVGVLIALALAIPVVETVARSLIRRSRQVRSSAKELSVVIVGSEVSGDHVKQTRATVERAGEVLMTLATETGSSGGNVATATGVSRHVLALSEMNAEILSDVVVIETLSDEMAQRTQQAVARVQELSEVAAGLDELVTGAKS